MKSCPKCAQRKPLSQFWTRADGRPASRCKTCSVQANREWRRANPQYEKARYEKSKVETRERHLIRKYGVNLPEYERMLANQGGKCAICHAPECAQFKGVFHVDHCHATGAVRGLLCRGCNHMLGAIKDDVGALQRAIVYLQAEAERVAA